ncbi:sugar phosphate isomerase/epimerase family protein [Photobacterium nomapromontoriensis]|uniref:sugar phosphate isomerase/epimerase family protein n=1 Tax=Photobacterium nomapromontoriensis TaxID=2910237 RepID=UPI003D0FD38E
MNNLAISNIAWKHEEELHVFNILNKLEIKNVEVAPAKVVNNVKKFTKNEVISYCNYHKKHNLNIVSMQALLFGGPTGNIFGDSTEVSEIQNHLYRVLEMAEYLGAKKLVFGSPKNRLKGQLSKVEAFEKASNFFAPLAKRANDIGAAICIENNPEYYGADFLTTTDEVCEFIKFANMPGLSAHFDTGGMFLAKENIVEAIDNNSEMISHFHISEKDLLPISSTDINHKEVANILKHNNYNNYITVEMKQTEQNVIDIEKSLEFVRKVYL